MISQVSVAYEYETGPSLLNINASGTELRSNCGQIICRCLFESMKRPINVRICLSGIFYSRKHIVLCLSPCRRPQPCCGSSALPVTPAPPRLLTPITFFKGWSHYFYLSTAEAISSGCSFPAFTDDQTNLFR